jgi:hypothetical protein
MLGYQAAAAYQSAATLAEAELVQLNAALASLRASLAAVEQERQDAARALGAVYLPVLEDTSIRTASFYTGLRVFDQRDPLAALAKEAARLKQTIHELGVDERFVRREALVGPAGSLTGELAEARDYLSPWAEECAKFESLPGFLELVSIGYDTPAFAERWWQPAYWRHWAAGDRVCAALGLGDFGDDVLPAWRRVAEPRDRWKAEVERVQGLVAAVHELVRERDAAGERLAHLPEIYLDECQAVLGRHLVGADPALLATWAEGKDGSTAPMEEGMRRGVLVGLKRLSGLSAKVDALTDAIRSWAEPAVAQLDQSRRTLRAKSTKYGTGKKRTKWVASAPTDYRAKMDRLAARRQKVMDTARRVQRFDDYEQFRLDNDPALWWLLFSDHRPPPLWMPGLRQWYDQHPGVVVVVDDDWAEARAARADTHHAESFAPSGDLS